MRRPALLIAVAAAGGIVVNVLAAGNPATDAVADAGQPISVAAQLGLSSPDTATSPSDRAVTDRLGELAAQRSQREAEQAAAAQSQAAADQAALDAKAAAEAQAAAEYQASLDAQAAAYQASLDYQASLERQAAAYQASLAAQKAAQKAAAAEAAAAAKAATAPASTPAPSSGSSSGSSSASASGSYQDYALAKLGGDTSEFSCLENLWGKESGWNPNAQNPSSTAYGIPQFLDSTWASTGIAKTSDGYRQIDAGLIYIDSRYGSPCGAWAHSKATGWY
jgi:hypothetical protein